MTNACRSTLSGRRILLVEDEPLLALDIVYDLEDAGAIVASAMSLPEALKACSSSDIDGAILDVDLKGLDVYPAAEVLKDRGVPFLFHTGHAKPADVSDRFPGAPIISKPAAIGRIVSTMASLVDREDVAA